MVTIRLARAGAKKRPFYHIVATEKSSPRDGRFIERIGSYNPNAKGAEQKLVVDLAKVEERTKRRIVMRSVGIPAFRAETLSPPMAKIQFPLGEKWMKNT